MNENQKKWLAWGVLVLAIVIAGFLGVTYPVPEMPGIGFSQQSVGRAHYEIPTYAPTDEPGLVIDNKSAGAVGLQVELNATPVWRVNRDGSVTTSGDMDIIGGLGVTGNVAIAGPTAIATATPALYVNNLGVSQPLSINDGGTELLGVINGGGIVIAAPTAIATGVPVVVIDSSGGLSNLFEIRDSATPVVQVNDGGLTDLGGGTGGTADGVGDLLVAGDAEIDDTLDVDGNIDLDGDGFDVEITAGASIDTDGATNLSASTGDITVDAEAGSLLLIGSEAAADAILLDANDTVTSGLDIDVGAVSGVTIDGGLVDVGGGTCGTANGDNDVCIAQDLEVDNTLDLDGDFDLDGDGFDVDITSGFSIDADSGSNVSLSAGDITVEAETGSITIKGDEADAAAVFIDANDAVTSGVNIDVGSVSGLTIDGGLTNIGGGTCATALGDNDLCVAGDIEVDGTIVLANTDFPLGYASSGESLIMGSTVITNSGTVSHGLTTPSYGVCSYSGQLTDNEEQLCSVNISGATVTIYTYKEDGSAGDSGVAIFWMLVGTP